MDPFEARIQFATRLKRLNARQEVISQCCSFAMANKELQDDFHSVILEVLDMVDLNIRLNILQFVQTLIDHVASIPSSVPLPERPYISNLQRDVYIVVGRVLPAENELVNLHAAYLILCDISTRLGCPDLAKFKDLYNSSTEEALSAEEESSSLYKAWCIVIEKKRKSQSGRLSGSAQEPTSANPLFSLPNEKILERMEHDRERHKRLKESLWVVDRKDRDERDEFSQVMSKFGALNDEDSTLLDELNVMANQCDLQMA